jgi:hypothetical protein
MNTKVSIRHLKINIIVLSKQIILSYDITNHSNKILIYLKVHDVCHLFKHLGLSINIL